MLSVDTSDLDEVLVSDGVELFLLLHKLWKLDVHGGSQGGTEVGGAGGDVTEMLVVSELGNSLDVGGGTGESLENGTNVSTLLHGNDSELIFFVNPHEEGLVVVVENTSVLGPVTVESAGLEETIAVPKNKI